MGIFKRRPKRVAILGCGPAGLFAAHAFNDAGWDVVILSKKRKSHMYGAQYLHRPIPGLPERSSKVEYQLWGSADDYASKVYGPKLPNGVQASPAYLEGFHDAWDIRMAYDEAWYRYEHQIIPTAIGAAEVEGFLREPLGYVVSTIPLPSICREPERHEFTAQKIWAAGDAPDQGRLCPISCPPDTVICNGHMDRAWYRVSNVFGHTTAEWPHDRRPPLSDIAEVTKPIAHNCDCWDPSRFVGVGRYGAWQKGVLSHHAYEQAASLASKR